MIEKLPEAVLFDVGDTLLRLDDYNLLKGVEALARALRLPDDSSSLESMRSTLEESILNVYLDSFSEFSLREYITAYLKRGNISADVQSLEMLLWQAIVRFQPMKGALEALRYFADRKVRLGVVSNAIFSDEILGYELEQHGMRGYFSCIVSSATFGTRKPHLSIFREGLKRLSAAGPETWFIGDSWTADMVGASLVGMTPVWLNPKRLLADNERRHVAIDSFDHLLTTVQGLR